MTREEIKETIQNDAYLLSCRCPACNALIRRGYDEETCYCSKCGQRVHMRAFTDEEIEDAHFEHKMDHYEEC